MNVQLQLATQRFDRLFEHRLEIVTKEKGEKVVVVKIVDGKRLVRRES